MTGIYKITNTINQKVYIGQAVDFHKRKITHKNNYLRYIKDPTKHKSGCRYLYNAFHKWGFDNFEFEFLEECERNKTILNEREQYWLDHYESYNRDVGYNIAKVAGSCLGVKHSDETKKKASDFAKTRIGDKNPFYGKSHSDETKERIRITKTGCKMPPGFIEKWGEHKIWELNKKEVLQYDIWGNLVAKWGSIGEASTKLNIKIGRISECLHGNQPTAGGFIWKFICDEYPSKIDPQISNSSFIRNFNKYYKENYDLFGKSRNNV
jgi:group I intron endonuclease